MSLKVIMPQLCASLSDPAYPSPDYEIKIDPVAGPAPKND
jgi:hypothetical protein